MMLGIVAEDIRRKLNPANSPRGFLGDQSTISEADVVEVISEFEDSVLSRIPARYQALLTRVDGEVLIGGNRSPGGATGGETEFTLGLYPASDLILYQNFATSWPGSTTKPWPSRTPSDVLPESYYTFVPATGKITLSEPLLRGYTLIAEYSHQACSRCQVLRRIVKDLVATEFARRLYPDEERFERYREWEQQAYTDINRMHRTDDVRFGLQMFDQLDLVNVTRVNRESVEAFDPDGGML